MLLVLEETAEGKVKIHVEIDFLNSLLSLGLGANVDSGHNKMIPEELVLYIVVAGVAKQGGIALCSDGAQLYHQGVSALLKVPNSMSVPPRPVPVLTPTTSVTAGEAEPQVGGEFAVRTVLQVFIGNLLVEGEGVLAGQQDDFPCG